MISTIKENIMVIIVSIGNVLDYIFELISFLTSEKLFDYGSQKITLLNSIVELVDLNLIVFSVYILAISLALVTGIYKIVKEMITGGDIKEVCKRIVLSVCLPLFIFTIIYLLIIFFGLLIDSTKYIFSEGNNSIAKEVFASSSTFINGFDIDDIKFDIGSVESIVGSNIEGVSTGMIDSNSFMYIPCLISFVMIFVSMFILSCKLMRNYFELAFYIVSMPVYLSLYSLDENKVEEIMKKIFSRLLYIFAIILGLKIYNILLPVFLELEIENEITNRLYRIIVTVGGISFVSLSGLIFKRMFNEGDDGIGEINSIKSFGAKFMGLNRLANRGFSKGRRLANSFREMDDELYTERDK